MQICEKRNGFEFLIPAIVGASDQRGSPAIKNMAQQQQWCWCARGGGREAILFSPLANFASRAHGKKNVACAVHYS